MKAKATEIWNLVQGGWIIELQKFKSLAYRRTTPADALAAASESRDVTQSPTTNRLSKTGC